MVLSVGLGLYSCKSDNCQSKVDRSINAFKIQSFVNLNMKGCLTQASLVESFLVPSQVDEMLFIT